MSETTHNQIIDAICKALDIDDIKRESRQPVYAHARFIAIKRLIDIKYSYCRIAYLLNRDLTTIYFGERRFHGLVKEDNQVFKDRIEMVKVELEGICA